MTIARPEPTPTTPLDPAVQQIRSRIWPWTKKPRPKAIPNDGDPAR
jgi:hypothetical protein